MRATTRLALSIEVDSDPISGSVSNAAGESQPFVGWIELVAAIEAARIETSGTQRQAPGEHAPPPKP